MTVPKLLYRNTQAQYAEAFVEEGEMLFRPLSYFRSLDDARRADDQEGAFVSNAAGTKIEVDLNGDGRFSSPLTLDNGQIIFKSGKVDQVHVKCFSLIPQPEFGDTTIQIFRPKEFLDALLIGLREKNAELEYGHVTYYDPDARLIELPPPPIWLLKRKRFESEREFRLSFFVEDREELIRRVRRATSSDVNYPIAPAIKIRVGPLKYFARIL